MFSFGAEVDLQFGFLALDLREGIAPIWGDLGVDGPYPGEPYQHNEFRALFSDHNPVVFKLTIPTADDD